MFVPGRRRGAFERLSQKTCLCITHKKASPDLGGCSFNHSRNLWNLLLYPSGYSFFVAEFTCPSYFVLLRTRHGPRLQVLRHFGATGWKKRAHNIVGNIMCVLPAGTREAHGLNPMQGWAMCFFEARDRLKANIV